MLEHIKNNKILIFFIIIILLSNEFIHFPSIGQLWSDIHPNSLIGFQKLLENNLKDSKYFFNIWENYLVRCLYFKISDLLIFILILIFIAKAFIKINLPSMRQ